MEQERLEGKIKIAHFKHGPEYAAAELAEQILEWTAGTGAKGGVVGLSGGVDSATVAYLCKYAFDSYNRANPDKEPLNLHGLIMPSNANQPEDTEDGLRVADALGIEKRVVSIQPLADSFIKEIPEVLKSKLDIGNLYAETRATVLSRFAGAMNLRIMGTGNHDEDFVLGYCTKRGYGVGGVDNNILGNLPKHLVRALAKYLGEPADLVNRIPTAGLWKGQTDEGELGYTYNQVHKVHRGYLEGKTPEKIAAITGYNIGIIKDIEYRHRASEHKRQLPPVGKVTLEYR